MRDLCNCNMMHLTITAYGSDTVIIKYQLSDDCILLIDDQKTKCVQYHTFFKLVMDDKWDVTFIEDLDEE